MIAPRPPQRRRLVSLDRSLSADCSWVQPDRYRDLYAIAKTERLAVQGSGLSIAACSFSNNSLILNMRNFNRLISFDENKQELEVEAGITLGEIFEFLHPRGYWLAVQPGYPGLTIGGCIAGNVHGKNHYKDGCFAEQVKEIKLYHPSHGMVTISDIENKSIFYLTCGGFGLTGVIISAVLRVQKILGKSMIVKHYKVIDLQETCTKLSELKERYDILYSWNNLARFDRRMGHGYIVAGVFDKGDCPSHGYKIKNKIDPNKNRIRIKLLNNFTMPFVNYIYYHSSLSEKEKRLDVLKSLFPWLGKEFYFDIVGKNGVIEPQVLVPLENVLPYCKDVSDLMRRHRQSFALASLKIARGNQMLLRFDGNGVVFSWQIPRSRKSLEFLRRLDEINVQYRAITNLIKDSRVPRDIVRAQYGDFDDFAHQIVQFDPNRRFVSALSERLGI